VNAGTVDIPPEVWDSYRGDALYLRVVDQETAEVVATYVRNKS
jgi:hypothetical protein